MSLWRLYYHLVWATKKRFPFITAEIESELYGYVIGKAHVLDSIIHAIGGTENHIHLVASVPPKLSISDFVKHIKGSSTHHLNHTETGCEFLFGWQPGYGVFSLGGKQLDGTVAYIRNQKDHHRNGTTVAALERQADEQFGPSVWHQGEAIDGIKVIKSG